MKKPKLKSWGKEEKQRMLRHQNCRVICASFAKTTKASSISKATLCWAAPQIANRRWQPGDRHQEDLINGNGQHDKVHSTFNLQFVIVSRGRARKLRTESDTQRQLGLGKIQSVCQQNVIIFFGDTIITKIFKSCSRTVALLDWHFCSGSRCTLRIRNTRFIYAPCAWI